MYVLVSHNTVVYMDLLGSELDGECLEYPYSPKRREISDTVYVRSNHEIKNAKYPSKRKFVKYSFGEN